MDKHTISPAGDPFHAAPRHDDTVEADYSGLELAKPEAPHACLGGTVYIGHLVEDPGTGEETEEFALYLCRRCSRSVRSGEGR